MKSSTRYYVRRQPIRWRMNVANNQIKQEDRHTVDCGPSTLTSEINKVRRQPRCPKQKTTMTKFQEGIAYFKEGKFSEALGIFNRLIADDPSKTDYLLFRGRTLSRLGSYQEALADFDKLVDMDPQNADLISDRAVVLHLLQRDQEALSELDRALSLDPDNPYRYSSRAFLKDRTGDPQGALVDYEKAIEMDPEDAIAHNNKGMVEEKLGYQEKSKQSFKIADELVDYTPQETKMPPINKPADRQEDIAPEQDEKLTLSSYLSTFSKVITDNNTRDEFLKFVSNKFKGKK